MILVNRSGVLRKHNKPTWNGLGNYIPKPCEGSRVLPENVLTYLEVQRALT